MEMVDKLLEERGEAVKEEEEGKDINSNFHKCSHYNEYKQKVVKKMYQKRALNYKC